MPRVLRWAEILSLSSSSTFCRSEMLDVVAEHVAWSLNEHPNRPSTFFCWCLLQPKWTSLGFICHKSNYFIFIPKPGLEVGLLKKTNFYICSITSTINPCFILYKWFFLLIFSTSRTNVIPFYVHNCLLFLNFLDI